MDFAGLARRFQEAITARDAAGQVSDPQLVPLLRAISLDLKLLLREVRPRQRPTPAATPRVAPAAAPALILTPTSPATLEGSPIGSYVDFEPLGVLCLVTSARSKGTCTLGLQWLFSSRFVLPYQELYGDKGIFQPGTPRKVTKTINGSLRPKPIEGTTTIQEAAKEQTLTGELCLQEKKTPTNYGNVGHQSSPTRTGSRRCSTVMVMGKETWELNTATVRQERAPHIMWKRGVAHPVDFNKFTWRPSAGPISSLHGGPVQGPSLFTWRPSAGPISSSHGGPVQGPSPVHMEVQCRAHLQFTWRSSPSPVHMEVQCRAHLQFTWRSSPSPVHMEAQCRAHLQFTWRPSAGPISSAHGGPVHLQFTWCRVHLQFTWRPSARPSPVHMKVQCRAHLQLTWRSSVGPISSSHGGPMQGPSPVHMEAQCRVHCATAFSMQSCAESAYQPYADEYH
eukprot:Em0016g757a